MPTQTMTVAPPKTTQTLSTSSNLATLRALYPRAAHAFLQRDISLTQSLINTAFSIIQPPGTLNGMDTLSSHRRKWDILRITLETTLYSSRGESDVSHSKKLTSLKSELVDLSPIMLLATVHSRSLRLFTPLAEKPSSKYLPSQILVALVLATLKLEVFQHGREMIEDWLTRRGQGGIDESEEGYEKVLEVYCLHVLPRLGEWDAAIEFLKYESELSPSRKQTLAQSLDTIYTEHLASLKTPTPTRNPTPKPKLSNGRPISPTPSASSISSTSTYTAVPATPRHPPAPSSALTTSSSTLSATPFARPTPPRAPTIPPAPRRAISLFQVIKTSMRPLIDSISPSSLIFFVLLPLIALAFRLRSRRQKTGPSRGAAEKARRRLRAGTAGAFRSITDTLQMAVRGLV